MTGPSGVSRKLFVALTASGTSVLRPKYSLKYSARLFVRGREFQHTETDLLEFPDRVRSCLQGGYAGDGGPAGRVGPPWGAARRKPRPTGPPRPVDRRTLVLVSGHWSWSLVSGPGRWSWSLDPPGSWDQGLVTDQGRTRNQ